MHRLVVAAALALATAFVPATASAATSIDLAVAPQTPFAGQPFTVVATGDAGGNAGELDGAFVGARERCEVSDWAIEDEIFDDFEVGPNAFSARSDYMAPKAGRYVICIKLETSDGAITAQELVTVDPEPESAACVAARQRLANTRRKVLGLRAELKGKQAAAARRVRKALRKANAAYAKADDNVDRLCP